MDITQLPCLLTELFKRTAQSFCEVALLRPRFPELEDVYEGDFDLVINPKHVNRFITQTWQFLTASQVDFFIHRIKQEKIRIEIIDPDNGRILVLELWQALQVRKAPGFAPWIFWEDIAPYIEEDEKCLTGYRLRPDVELCYYLSHLQTKKKLLDTPLVALRIKHYSNSTNFPENLIKLISGPLVQENLQALAQSANSHLHDIKVLNTKKINLNIIFHLIKDFIFRMNLMRSRSSKLVAFLGPDGVGKTTLIQTYLTEIPGNYYYFKFKNSYRRSIFYKPLLLTSKFYFKIFKSETLEKNQIDERIALILIFISALKVRIRGLLDRLRGRFALADRGFSDFLIQGTRFADQSMQLNKKTQILFWLTPPPRAIVHLYAPEKTIAARKAELNIEQITQYQALTLEAYLRHPPMAYAAICTNRSLKENLATLKELANVFN